MKYIFGTNKGAEAKAPDGEVFITAKSDEEFTAKIGRTIENAAKLVDRQAFPLPLWLSIVKWIGGFAGIIGLYMVLASVLHLNEKTLPLDQLYHNVPWMFHAAAVGTVLFIILYVVERIKKKQLKDSGELEKGIEEGLAMDALIAEKLGIPEKTHDIDVITFDYKETADGIESNSQSALTEVSAWCDGDDLKLALISDEDGALLYTLPIADMKGLAIERMGFNVMNWNKDWDIVPKKHEVYGIRTAGQF
ncbi:MAG: hypothetical protein IJM85_05550, partial [Clostridia bacterium]|nr:hypothetical protein [Clostridia bacterium]